jgi:hypothetical protein
MPQSVLERGENEAPLLRTNLVVKLRIILKTQPNLLKGANPW